MPQHDKRLDHWIETKVLKRGRPRTFGPPAYTRYTNKALHLLSEIEMPFILSRGADLRYTIRILGRSMTADRWHDVASCICRLLFKLVEGVEWENSQESSHAEQTAEEHLHPSRMPSGEPA